MLNAFSLPRSTTQAVAGWATGLLLGVGLATGAHAQTVADPFGLGAASQFAVLDLSGKFEFTNPQSSITGNLGVVSGGSLNTSDGIVTGDVYLGSGVTPKTGNVKISGAIKQDAAANTLLNQAFSDANAASATLAGKTATQTFGTLKNTQTITGVSGLNVINTSGIDFSNGILTFAGPSDALFVINDTGGFKFSNSQFLAGMGLSPDSILFNVLGGDTTITGGGGDALSGIILNTAGSITYHDKSLSGAFIGNNISITSAGKVIGPPPPTGAVPEAGSLALAGLGGLMLLPLAFRARRTRIAS